MEEGALGLTTALIYSPDSYAKTPELAALASESARRGGMYIAHIRSEGDRILEAVQESIDIAKTSGAPAEIYHLKVAGKANWSKLGPLIDMIEAARAGGTRITADMYTYIAGATGLDAAMAPWVQDGGLEAWIARLRDPSIRAKVIAEMRNPSSRPLIGRTLADVAASRHVSPEDAAIDLVIENGARVEVAYFLTGVEDVWVNGVRALKNGVATGAASGRVVRGRARTGALGGGCRASARDWRWE
jgi:N-acyl-D-amino-acid deacylase